MPDVLAPQGKLDLTAVTQLHSDLMARSGQDIVMDMSGVSQIGALCLQCCIAAARDAARQGRTFTMTHTPETVCSQLASMGVDPQTLAEGVHAS